MNADGSGRTKALPDAIIEFEALSADGKWAAVAQAVAGDPSVSIVAMPLVGGSPVNICRGYCYPFWNASGTLFSILPGYAAERTVQIPVSPGKNIPELPPDGVPPDGNVAAIRGAKALEAVVIAGPGPDLSATLHQTVHRNLYRVPLR